MMLAQHPAFHLKDILIIIHRSFCKKIEWALLPTNTCKHQMLGKIRQKTAEEPYYYSISQINPKSPRTHGPW